MVYKPEESGHRLKYEFVPMD